MKKYLSRFFEIEKNKTSFSREIRAGAVSFFSVVYIVNVHPFIVSQAGVDFHACVTSTVLICFFSSLTMSLYARNPLVMAPGLGVNAFFTYHMILHLGIPFEQALGAVFWSGVLFLILSIFKIREFLFQKIPEPVKYSVSPGIGLMIAFAGFQQGGVAASSKDTLVQMAPLSAKSILFIMALLFTVILLLKKIKGAFCYVILLTALCAVFFGRFWGLDSLMVEYKGVFSRPDFSLAWRIDFLGSLQWSVLPSILSLAFVDLVESFGTLAGVLGRFDLTEGVQKKPRRLKQSLITDALGTIYSSLFGSSSATVYVESISGIQEGGRTGLCALTSAVLFLPFLFLSPLLSMMPDVAAAPLLVAAGVLMMEPVRRIQWKNWDTAVPAFLTLSLIPLTFSITHGIVWGLLSSLLIHFYKKLQNNKPNKV